MAQTPPPGLTAPPPAPSRADSATFATLADAFIAWFATLYTDLLAALANVYNNAVDAYNNALASSASAAGASASEIAAAASAAASAGAAGAAIWVSGTTYAIGDVRWSPANRYTYRRITAGAGTTDPSADPANWALAGVAAPQLVVVSGAARSMSANEHAVLTNAAASTATLPPSPAEGDVCWITGANGRSDNLIARNGKTIMGLAEDLTVNVTDITVQLRYAGATWRIL